VGVFSIGIIGAILQGEIASDPERSVYIAR
jgi:hypothetical protein